MGSSPLLLLPALLALPGAADAAGLDVDDPTPRPARLELVPGGPVLHGDFAVSGGSGVLSFPPSESERFLEAINRGDATSVTVPLEIRVDPTTHAVRADVAGSLESEPGEPIPFIDDVSFDTASDALAGFTGVAYCSTVEEFITQCGAGGFFEGQTWCPALPGVFPPGTLLEFDAAGFPTPTASCSFVAGSPYKEATGHAKLVGLQAVVSTGLDGGGPPIVTLVVYFAEREVLLLEDEPTVAVPALSMRGGLTLGAALALIGAARLRRRLPPDAGGGAGQTGRRRPWPAARATRARGSHPS